MGFSSPLNVRVHGYGALRQPEVLDDSYIDDLPLTPAIITESGIYFYAVGPVGYTGVLNNRLVPTVNPFTTHGYYYLTESSEDVNIPTTGQPQVNGTVSTRYNAVVHHKSELFNPGQTGHELMGEDFLTQPTRSLNFSLPGAIAGSQAWMECTFYTKNPQSSRLVISVNDKALTYTSSDDIRPENEHYTHALKTTTRKNFDVDSDKARVTINHSRTGNGSLARLGHVAINYERELQLTDGQLDFHLYSGAYQLSGCSDATIVWDVTDPMDIKRVDSPVNDGKISITVPSNTMSHFVAWNPGAKLPVPTSAGPVTNQDIHSQPVPDMVIFTHADWSAQARRVAQLHEESDDSLRVLIVEPQQLYNEFSSGAPDAQAIRKLLKMFYDRSTPGAKHRLRYLLIMGRSTYDNRRITSNIAALPYPTLPCWQSDNSLSDNTSFTTDDMFTLLLDGAGANPARDHQCIAVGRMPVTSLSDARTVVDKLVSYVTTPVNTAWKNKAIIVADDENQAKFMMHSDWLVNSAMESSGGSDIMYNKVYIDAYQQQNSTYPQARADMFRLLSEGAALWTFAGHANPTSWTGNGLMTYNDINNLYIKHYPWVIAATCDFLRWDARDISAAEILYRMPQSGIIAALSATRPATIDANGDFLNNLGKHIFRLDDSGRYLPIGEIYRCSKNNSAGNGTWNNGNKLRYVLMGDPAMRLCTPSRRVAVDSVNHKPIDGDEQIIIQARQLVKVTGRVLDNDGTQLDDLKGQLYVTLYDAEYSTTSHGYGEGEEYAFDQQGKRLHTSIHPITDGRFEIEIPMPSEIADNFRPAALDLYAVSDDGSRDAMGVERRIYVYGTDLEAADDDTPPTIDEMYLNHPSAAGQAVNDTPVLVAHVSDNRAVNLSSSGIGHQMLITLDDKRTLTDVPLYYTPSSDGTPSGSISYPLPKLTAGVHTVTLRVWDTSENAVERSLEFEVNPDARPVLYDLWVDANPARTETNFYLSHDRPNALAQLTVEVFNLMGQRVWNTTVSGIGSHDDPYPVHWNLTDNAGRRLTRGIYLYRGSVTDEQGQTSSTTTRRIAITAP